MKRISLILWCFVFFVIGFLSNYVFFSDVGITANAVYDDNISNCSQEVINNTIFVEKDCDCEEEEDTSLEDSLNEAGENFAKLYLDEDIEALYDFVSEDAKEIMSEVKFYELYKPVLYGIKFFYLESGEVLSSIRKQEYKTMYVDDFFIKEGIGYVNYSTRDLRDNLSHTTRQFVLEDDGWKSLEFNIIAEGGCSSDDECMDNDDILRSTCTKQCSDFRFMGLLKKDSYECKENFCHCKCFNKETEIGRNIKADLVNKYR